MTKTELENQEIRQSLKKEILNEIRQDTRRRRQLNYLGCFAVAVVVIVLPSLFVAGLLAKTGLVEVPFLTSRLYRSAVPERQVTPLIGSSTSQILLAEASRPKINPNFGTFTVSFNESELTTMAREGVASAGASLPLPIKSVQIAVNADAVELFVTTPQDGRDVTIKALIVPIVDAGSLKIEINELRIGALEVPAGSSRVLASLLDRYVGQAIVSSIEPVGQLVGIKIEKGIMRFEIVPHKSTP